MYTISFKVLGVAASPFPDVGIKAKELIPSGQLLLV